MAFQGSLKELPLPDIIQLMSVSGKTGVFTIKTGEDTGEIFLRDGQIVHATVGDLGGEEAVYELAIWPEGDFVFTPGRETVNSTIQKSNTNLLMEAARRIDEWKVLSKRIPSTRLVPVFSPQSSNTSVSFTPQEWELIRKIDERRSIDEVAIGLNQSPFETCKVLYGLITSGLVELREHLGVVDSDRLSGLSPIQLGQLVDRIHQLARQLLSGHQSLAELDRSYRLSRTALESGRGLDSVLDLVRADEQLISSALGPNQAKAFLGRVQQLIAGV